MTEAEVEMASALSLPELPSVEEQITEIETRVLSPLGLDSPIPDDYIDDMLRTGGGRRNSIQRIIGLNIIDLPGDELTEAVQREYGDCTKGLLINGQKLAMSTDEAGMHMALSDSVHGSFTNITLTWEQTANRIRDLIHAGMYAQQGVLDDVQSNRLHEYAQALQYMRRDIAEEAGNPIFEGFDLKVAAFDDEVHQIEELLSNPESLRIIVDRLDEFAKRYQENPKLMRFRYYRPDRIAPVFHRLLLPVHSYPAQTGYIPEPREGFITGDQIDRVLVGNMPYENGKLDVYSYYCRHTELQERATHLKEYFGTGGRMPALSGVDALSIDYDAKGIRLKLGSLVNPEDAVTLKWPEVARRIDLLIQGDNFMTAKDYAQIPEYESEQLARSINNFFSRLPEDFTSPFTPVSNSMVELYTIMRYLQYGTLQKMGLGHFDSWAAAFGDTVTAIELAPEGTGYRAKTRFARFYNLPELIFMFKECADIRTADMLHLPVPKAEFINEVLQPSDIQQEMVTSFSERAEQVRSGAVDAKVDNMLKITNDGRKCALDQRLINDMLPDSDTGKVNACVRNAFQVWQDGIDRKTTQLIFCDLSTPKADGSFNVYDDVKRKLIERGVPQEEIAFIHDADTETKKAELFAKVRAGHVRILLGSTPKLGAGTNIQDRLIALHHLDAPWKPSDLEQQEGRILRQGNDNEQVQIYRYVTEGTFDAYMWQVLENKQKFISQIMTSKSPVHLYLHPEEAKLLHTVHKKPAMELYQRYYENGEYVRSASPENSAEQNYNMIDGTNNNRDPQKRPSVRKRLKEKLALIHGGQEMPRE